MAKKLEHINRRLTDEERQRLARIREGAQRDFPPASSRRAAAPGIPAVILSINAVIWLSGTAPMKPSAGRPLTKAITAGID